MKPWTMPLGGALMLALCQGAAARSFDDLLAGQAEAQVKTYAQPLGDALSVVASAGAFHGARSKGIAGLDAGLKVVLSPLGAADIPAGTLLDETEASAVGLPMLVVNKGLFKGFQVGARYMSLELSKDVGKLDHMGASLRFEVNELFHVPLIMPRIGLQGDWNQLKVGESITTTTTGVDLIVSKSFLILEPYAGLSLVKGTTDLDYTYDAAGTPVNVGVSLDSDVTRLTAGLNLTPFPLLRLNAEYALTDYPTYTLGVLVNLF
jgi:hypothetical protein